MAVLMTGFPDSWAARCCPGSCAGPAARRLCLVQPKYADLAARRAEELAAADTSLPGRIQLIEGDIAQPGLGLNGRGLDGVTEAGISLPYTTWRSSATWRSGSTSKAPAMSSTHSSVAPTSSACTTSAPATSAGATPARSARTISRSERRSTTTTRRPSTTPRWRSAGGWRPGCRRRSTALDRRRRQPHRRDAEVRRPLLRPAVAAAPTAAVCRSSPFFPWPAIRQWRASTSCRATSSSTRSATSAATASPQGAHISSPTRTR